jgi:hypothetical protein
MTGFPLDNAYITAENNLAVSDEQAIRQVIARLNHSLDAADYPLYASFFSPILWTVLEWGAKKLSTV